MAFRASLRVLHMLVLALLLVALARPAPSRADTLDEYSSDFLDLFTPGTILAEGDYGFVIVDTKTGRIVPVEGGTPGPLTLLGDGREVAQLIWWKGDNAVVDISRGKLVIIHYATWSIVPTITEVSIPGLNAASPGTAAVFPDGSLGISVGNGAIVQVTTSLQVNGPPPMWTGTDLKVGTPWRIPTPAGAAGPPSALNFTVGSDGNLWFTETHPTDAQGHAIVDGKERIGRVTPTGVITEFAEPTSFAGTGSVNTTLGTYVTLGSDGNVWFTEASVGKLGRITPAGVVTEFALPHQGTLLGIVAGPDGNLWVKDYYGSIYRVTPAGTITTFAIPTKSAGSDVELVPGPDGAVWFAEDTGIARITMTGVITEYLLPMPSVNGTPMYPYQLAFTANGRGALIEYTSGKFATFTMPTPASGTVSVQEFYNAALDHYFISTVPAEISDLETGVHVGWQATGLAFNAFPAGHAGTSPICRFYIPPALGDSHFFGRGTAECQATAQKNPSFDEESPEVMDMILPTAGVCPANTVPVYRVFSNRPDANHRYTTVRAVRDAMVAKGWVAEGDGPDLVVMCSP